MFEIIHPRRRTKIVCTLGPAVASEEKLREMVRNGMDIARLNFSHGAHANFAEVIEQLRKIEKEEGKPVGILADIQGPKLRVGQLKNGSLELVAGQKVIVTTETIEGSVLATGEVLIPTAYKDFVKDVEPGHTVLLDDGLLELKAQARISETRLQCEVVSGGLLKNNKGINVPQASFSAPSITEKDYDDILFCTDQGVDFIAMSFVRTAQEVRHLKQFLKSRGKRTQVIAKIEKPDAISNLESIIDASDGILIARGDLAVEVGNERVPVLQKKIIRKCNLRGKTVILATQMLMSMVDNPRPSRAEASDVANAVVDGADVLMLSNETAIGRHPIESLQMMERIAIEMEQEPRQLAILWNEWELPEEGQHQVALLQSAVRLASIVKARRMVVLTESGRSALLVSKCRPSTSVIAITPLLETYRQLSVQWGVEAIYMPDMKELMTQTAVFEAVGQRLQALRFCQSGDKIIITAGFPQMGSGSTNTIKIHQI